MSKKADSRTVSTDALETLGTVIDSTQKRDAIHLAVIPMKASTVLYPGQHVAADGLPVTPYSVHAVGIVDPFLTGALYPESWFWLVIYPRKITSLRHVWSHESFPEELGPAPIVEVSQAKSNTARMSDSITFINDEAASHGLSYDEFMRGAGDYLEHGDYLSEGERWEGSYVNPEFWNHYEIVTGQRVAESNRGSFFSCSC